MSVSPAARHRVIFEIMHHAPSRTLVERQSTWWAFGTALIVGVVAFIVGYQRRWMSDDGLIVLRTVRNLLDGNGQSSTLANASKRILLRCGSTSLLLDT